MYLEIFLADFAVFRVSEGISRDFAEIPEFSRVRDRAKYQKPWIADLTDQTPVLLIILDTNILFSRQLSLNAL